MKNVFLYTVIKVASEWRLHCAVKMLFLSEYFETLYTQPDARELGADVYRMEHKRLHVLNKIVSQILI